MKTSSFAIAAVVLAGLAAPLASTAALASDSFDRDYVLGQLLQKGVNATDVFEGWNGQVRAVVQLADGSSQFQYFYEDTLQPVNASKPNTRVLTKLDVGTKAPAATTESLLEDHFFD